MKYTIERISEGENEVILKYHTLTPEVEQILNFLNYPRKKLMGFKENVQVAIDLSSILYIESVDGKTFVYTVEDVFKIKFSLVQLEQILNTINFFRSSKAMIINIDKVAKLKSLSSNRIDATMCNGEHIMISRTYASDFRKRLKGGTGDE